MSQSKDVDLVVRVIAQTAVDNEKYFCELDGVVGDGDFGYSIARGFEKVLKEWDTMDHSLPGNFLKKVSSIIVGGSAAYRAPSGARLSCGRNGLRHKAVGHPART